MSFVPSPMQEEVILHRGGSLLVSAAAGSGKTTTLIAHVLSRLCEKEPEKRGDLRRMIIVTYTNAAASEMRAKLIRELRAALENDLENAWLRLQSEIAPQAHICTVDSLCGFLVRSYFDRLDISPDIRIADNAELVLLKADVMDALMEEKYEAGDDRDFLDLITDYSSEKSDAEIRKMVLGLYETAQNALYPEEWLEEAEKPQPEEEALFWEQDWILAGERKLEGALFSIRARMESLRKEVLQSEASQKEIFLPLLQSDEAIIDRLLEADFAEKQKLLSVKTKWMTKPSLKKKTATGEDEALDEQLRAARNRYKAEYQNLEKRYGREPSRSFSLVRMTEKPKKALLALARAFSLRFKAEMQSRNMTDFIGMEHYALNLLTERAEDGRVTRTPLARQLAEGFDEIIIDEYQDINNVQDEILHALSGEDDGRPNLFMVGDVKQSIYRFRRANPEIFLQKYKSYGTEPGAETRRIDLSANYRSRKEIVDGVNDLFWRIMDEPLGGIVYDEKAKLHFGAAGFGGTGHVPEVLLCEKVGNAGENRSAEAKCIGRKILELTKSGSLQDGSPDKTRRVRFRDIRILMKSLNDARVYVDALGEMGIPVSAPLKHGFYDTQEVQTVLALLKTIDNPRQDIPLASVMTSPFGAFQNSDLADIAAWAGKEAPKAHGLYERLQAAWMMAPERFGKVGRFLEELSSWRDLAEVLSIPALIHRLMTETGYELYLRAMPGGMARLANLETLLDRAEAFENTSYRGLYQFNRYIERVKDSTDEGEAAPVQDDDDVVHIDTIHSSKGLQYPVVFLAGASTEFNLKDAQGAMLVHEKEGAALETRNRDTRQRLRNLRLDYIADKITEEAKAEELRVLYVALTRAEEYLFISGTVSDPARWREAYPELSGLPDGPLPAWSVAGASSYLDWILMAAAAGTPHLVIRPDNEADEAKEGRRGFTQAPIWEDLALKLESIRENPPEIPEELEKRVHFRYPYEALSGVRGIYTVSALKQAAGEEPMEPLPKNDQKRPENSGVGSLNGAERGTVYHKIMEHLKVDGTCRREDVAAQLEAMQKKGLLRQEEAAAVPAEEVAAFWQTPLADRIRRADQQGRLFREQPFILGVPLAEIDAAHAESRETVLIQGIADLYFEEEGELILVDYKTDRVAQAEVLAARYRTQLDYYRRALEQATGKIVGETYIYSTVLRQLIAI